MSPGEIYLLTRSCHGRCGYGQGDPIRGVLRTAWTASPAMPVGVKFEH